MDEIPEDADVVTASETGAFPLGVIVAHVASMLAWSAFGVYDARRARRADPAPADADAVGASSGACGLTRTALGWARSFWFCFGVFFVLYHLCYENIIHKTDGMEYLSDWTFVLLGVVFGLLGAHSLLAPGAVAPSLTETAVVLHGICWSTNVLSTAGAWYSFFFFPQCESLEGVDNYPACYLEWYRLTEHGLNMLILLGDYAVGLVPVRRKDYGYSLLFLAVYSVWTWYVWSRDGKCPYVMFDFNAGWSSVPWFNFSFVGVTAAFFLTEKMYARRDAKRLANGETNGLGASGGLPSHVTYEAANADEYEYK